MKKRALCIGINNYPGTGSDLSGCVNDANDWKAELQKRGYDVVTVLDAAATRDNIVAQLKTLLQGASDGDSLVVTYSGHGSWLPDADGDESDGRDEMLCPYDINRQHYLTDDVLASIFAQKPQGARLFFVSDSCHSGTVTRFAPDPLGGDDAAYRRARLLPPEQFVTDENVLRNIRRLSEARSSSRQKYPALLLAGCKDVEVSYDASFNGRPNGALTRVALDALKSNPSSYLKWYELIRKKLPSPSYPQTPQLYGKKADKNGSLF